MWLFNKTSRLNNLKILLCGKKQEKEAILFIMNKFQETTVYHMEKYIKCDAEIARLEKEIELLAQE